MSNNMPFFNIFPHQNNKNGCKISFTTTSLCYNRALFLIDYDYKIQKHVQKIISPSHFQFSIKMIEQRNEKMLSLYTEKSHAKISPMKERKSIIFIFYQKHPRTSSLYAEGIFVMFWHCLENELLSFGVHIKTVTLKGIHLIRDSLI